MNEAPKPDLEAPPPLFGTWNRAYAAVLASLALWTLLFWVLTTVYS